MADDFSNPGDSPTPLELDIFRVTCVENPRHIEDQWVMLAHRIGLESLCIVLDEIGGIGMVSIPSRREFFMRIYRKIRSKKINQMLDQGMSIRKVARKLHISARTVQRARGALR